MFEIVQANLDSFIQNTETIDAFFGDADEGLVGELERLAGEKNIHFTEDDREMVEGIKF